MEMEIKFLLEQYDPQLAEQYSENLKRTIWNADVDIDMTETFLEFRGQEHIGKVPQFSVQSLL